MLLPGPHDTAYPAGPLTASQLLARFSDVRGPDLREPGSVHKRRPLASWGLPTYARWRKVRRESTSCQPATVPGGGTSKLAIGVTTAWSANSPPAQPGA
jgi:hypothetical protein